MKIILLIIMFLLPLKAESSFILLEQKECNSDYSGENIVNTYVIGDDLNIEVTMSFSSGLVLVNPQLKFSKKSITLKVDSGSTTGLVGGCSCKKVFTFKIKASDVKNYKKAYIVIDGVVYDEVDLKSTGDVRGSH